MSSFENFYEHVDKNLSHIITETVENALLNSDPVPYREIRGPRLESTEIVCDSTLVTNTPTLGVPQTVPETRRSSILTPSLKESVHKEELEDEVFSRERTPPQMRPYHKTATVLCPKLPFKNRAPLPNQPPGDLHEDSSPTNSIADNTEIAENGFICETPSGCSTPKRLSTLRVSEFGDIFRDIPSAQPRKVSEQKSINVDAACRETTSSSTLNQIARLRGIVDQKIRPITMYSEKFDGSLECLVSPTTDSESRGLETGLTGTIPVVPSLSLYKTNNTKAQMNLMNCYETQVTGPNDNLKNKLRTLIEDLEMQRSRLEDIQNDPAMRHLCKPRHKSTRSTPILSQLNDLHTQSEDAVERLSPHLQYHDGTTAAGDGLENRVKSLQGTFQGLMTRNRETRDKITRLLDNH